MRLGIIGAGWIAAKMGETLRDGLPGVEPYAIAARDLSRAEQFAKTWGFSRAYGSYEELVNDANVDLVYIATPHSHHFQHTMLALTHNKPCLVEKAFTANVREAQELVRVAREKHLFLAEAIWTRYQPMRTIVTDLLRSGKVGAPRFLTATLGYQMTTKERILNPALCGGAMLDLGVYCINFLRMFIPGEPVQATFASVKSHTGMDMTDTITYIYPDGLLACLHTSCHGKCDQRGVITCERGRIEVENVNNPQRVRVFDGDERLLDDIPCPTQITGYEYQLLACRDALAQGLTESPFMPLDETLRVMQLMDDFRHDQHVVYPMD